MIPGNNKYSIRLKFNYNISNSLEGFYLSTYKVNGTERLVYR